MHFKTFWGQKLKFPMAMEDQGHMGGGGQRAPVKMRLYHCSDSVQALPPERKVNHKLSYSAQVVKSTNCWRMLKRDSLYSLSTPVSTPVTHPGADFPQFSREKDQEVPHYHPV